MHKTRVLTSSIVICAYNEQETIAKVIDHCLDQTRPFEAIIVVDNNSKDDTAKIIKGYAKKHSHVKYMFQPKQGVMAARTMGFDAVTSDIIAKTDADTYLAPNWNETMLAAFESDSALDGVTGPARYYGVHEIMSWYELITEAHNFASPPMLYGFSMALTKKIWNNIRSKTCTDERFFDDIDTAHHIVEAGGRITYSRKMVVRTSSRRYRDSTRQLFNYWSRWTGMYAAHGQSILSKVHQFFFVPLTLLVRCLPFRIYFLIERARLAFKF